MAEIKLKIASVVIGSGEGGGSGVAPYYADLPDKPSINGETLSGDMTSEDLGLASESQAVPSGGTTGQVLAKKSNADNDVQWVNQESGGQGTTNYADLENKPKINNVTLSGNKTAAQLGLQPELVSGTNIKTINNQSIVGSGNITIEGGGTDDYVDLDNKPQINSVTLSGNKTLSQLGIQSELTFDNTPTANSNNPVKSGGVKTALDSKQDTLVSGTSIKTVNNTSLLGSGNIQINDGVGFQTITTQQDGTMVITLTNGDTITVDLNHTHPNYYKKTAETSQPSGGFLPDVEYNLGTLTGNVTFALASAVSGNMNHYFWTFSTPSVALSVTWPSGITWVDGSAPTISASYYYEISILNGCAMYLKSAIQTPS